MKCTRDPLIREMIYQIITLKKEPNKANDSIDDVLDKDFDVEQDYEVPESAAKERLCSLSEHGKSLYRFAEILVVKAKIDLVDKLIKRLKHDAAFKAKKRAKIKE